MNFKELVDRIMTGKTYRVLEVKKGGGKSDYFPQVRSFYFWTSIVDPTYNANALSFDSLDQANRYLYDIQLAASQEKIVKKTSHPFNAVFYKLKQTNIEETGANDANSSNSV